MLYAFSLKLQLQCQLLYASYLGDSSTSSIQQTLMAGLAVTFRSKQSFTEQLCLHVVADMNTDHHIRLTGVTTSRLLSTSVAKLTVTAPTYYSSTLATGLKETVSTMAQIPRENILLT